MYTPLELLALAKAYQAATGLSLYTVSKRAVGNGLTFDRIARGHGCLSKTMARGTRWFDANWPSTIPWPLRPPGTMPTLNSIDAAE